MKVTDHESFFAEEFIAPESPNNTMLRTTSLVRLCRLILLVLFCASLPPACSGQSAAATDGKNLVQNHDFEAGMSPWGLDNFGKNVADLSLDHAAPHGGSQSLCLRLNSIVGFPGTYANSRTQVRPGSAVKISFWARGVSNGAPLALVLRRSKAPTYTVFFRVETNLTDEWQQYVYTTLLPRDFEQGDVSIRFGLNAPGVFWVDDISVVELPPVEQGEAATVNPVRNPSFEAGTDGWTATFRQREFPASMSSSETGTAIPSPPDAHLETRENGSAPQGRRYLTLTTTPESYAYLTSAYFPARYGHPTSLVFWLRSDRETSFEVGVGSGKNSDFAIQSVTHQTSAEWQKYTIPFTLKPASGGLYLTQFTFSKAGRYDLDAVSLVEDGTTPVLYPASVAIRADENTPTAHMFAPQQKASFVLVATGEAPGTKLTFQVSVVDYRERTTGKSNVSLLADKTGYGEAKLRVPTTHLGAFRLEARQVNSPLLLAEQIYTVLPPLPPPASRPDSFFGGHLDLSPYNLQIARLGGFRWIRLYPPLSTKWMVVEPTPDNWTFPIENVSKAAAQGFHILGSFDTAPDFAADIDPKSSVRNRWSHSYPPKDLTQWKEYVTRTYKAFSPYVSAWELWNEPDGGYLQVRSGLKKDDVYLSLLHATREALDAVQKPSTLIGPTTASIGDPLAWQVLDGGGAHLLDATSFHFYSVAAGGGSPNIALAAPLLAKYETYHNREGEPMPLWVTEAGAYLIGGHSWLTTYRIPPTSAVTPSQAGAAIVRTALYFKAMGVKHFFDYALGTSAAGRRMQFDEVSAYIDVTGIPGPGLAAHAAMVALTEDAAPAGFDADPKSPIQLKVAHFRSAQGRVDVYWSNLPALLQSVADLHPNDQVRDLMGNAVDRKTAQTGEFPLYVLRPDTESKPGKP